MRQGGKGDNCNYGVPKTEDCFVIPWLEKIEERAFLRRLYTWGHVEGRMGRGLREVAVVVNDAVNYT